MPDVVVSVFSRYFSNFRNVLHNWSFIQCGNKRKMGSCEAILLALLCILVITANGKTDPSDVAGLEALHRSLTDNSGLLTNWGIGDPCDGNWMGVYCSDPNHGELRNVIKLHLMKLNLSGSLPPDIGKIDHLQILDIMWNNISGSIPKEIGNLQELELLLLNGNQLTGTLPEELGDLNNLNRIQIDENKISGPLPASLSRMKNAQHFHMNNNSINGTIPWQFGRLPKLLHLLLDNNNLNGELPASLADISSLAILQLDNNQLRGGVPKEYTKLTNLIKLSLRNCNLTGQILDFHKFPKLKYLDLSKNTIGGSLPAGPYSSEITAIDLSQNNLTGEIPEDFGKLTHLQALLMENNNIEGEIPTNILNLASHAENRQVVLNFQNNNITVADIKETTNVHNSIWLYNNPICKDRKLTEFCVRQNEDFLIGTFSPEHNVGDCDPASCSPGVDELIPALAISGQCECATPLKVGIRLESPGFRFFPPYIKDFTHYFAEQLLFEPSQVYIETYTMEVGPRLDMKLKIFPSDKNKYFTCNKIENVFSKLSEWKLKDNPLFGPKELKYFDSEYRNGDHCKAKKSGKHISTGAFVGSVIATIVATVLCLVLVIIFLARKPDSRFSKHLLSTKILCKLTSCTRLYSAKETSSKYPFLVSEAKSFSFDEIAKATNNFHDTRKIGEGHFGRVYSGILENGEKVAVKRASRDTMDTLSDFYSEINLISHVHHRNLVSLVGYCDVKNEMILVFEFMENGSLHDSLHKIDAEYLDFRTRLSIALGASRGMLYLHTGVTPSILHMDIKSSNILLDKNRFAKVADFGLSRHSLPDGGDTNTVRGTPGYIDPEYFLTCRMTPKSDVYSFGIVLLELMTGMTPIFRGKSLAKEIKKAWDGGSIESHIDVQMKWYPIDDVKSIIELALCCVDTDPDCRPAMSQVVDHLYSLSMKHVSFDDDDSSDKISSVFETSKTA